MKAHLRQPQAGVAQVRQPSAANQYAMRGALVALPEIAALLYINPLVPVAFDAALTFARRARGAILPTYGQTILRRPGRH